MEHLLEFMSHLATLLAMALPVIGITGGLQQFFAEAPDLQVGPFLVKGGRWLSALIAGLFWGLGHLAGWLPPLSGYESLSAAAAAEYALFVTIVSAVYVIGGFKATPEPTPEPPPTGRTW